MGEGGAVLVLEEFEAAQARGAHIYCEVAGFASRGNAYHMTGLRPDGARDDRGDHGRDGARAGSTPEDIDYINAHGSGTKQNDRHETAAYKQRPRRAGLQDPDQLDQVDDRPLARRHRRDRDGRLCAGHRPRRGPADRELGEPRPGVRPRLHARTRRAGGTVDAALSTGSGFGGFQSAMIVSLPEELQGGGGMSTPAAGAAAGGLRGASGRDAARAGPPRRHHRHRRRGAERRRHGVLVGGDQGGQERRSAASPASTRRSTPPSSPARSTGFDADDYIERRLMVQTDRWTYMALAATQMALRRTRTSTRRGRTRTR